MKALNIFLTTIIILVGCFFFAPLCFAIGIHDAEKISILGEIGAYSSTFAGTIFTLNCAKKFYEWFNSHIK